MQIVTLSTAPEETGPFIFDFTRRGTFLAAGTIASAIVEVFPEGTTVSGIVIVNNGKGVQFDLTGCAANRTYSLKCIATNTAGYNSVGYGRLSVDKFP